MHLTNYSINKNNVEYQTNKGNNDEINDESSKWNFKTLRNAFDEMGISYDGTFTRIHELIIKTLISVEQPITQNLNKSTKYKNLCFEVFGFDVLLDSKLKPWLLEVNVCPSLSLSSPFDKKIKTLVICDAFNTIGVQIYDRKQVEKEQEENLRKRIFSKENEILKQ